MFKSSTLWRNSNLRLWVRLICAYLIVSVLWWGSSSLITLGKSDTYRALIIVISVAGLFMIFLVVRAMYLKWKINELRAARGATKVGLLEVDLGAGLLTLDMVFLVFSSSKLPGIIYQLIGNGVDAKANSATVASAGLLAALGLIYSFLKTMDKLTPHKAIKLDDERKVPMPSACKSDHRREEVSEPAVDQTDRSSNLGFLGMAAVGLVGLPALVGIFLA